MQCSKCRRKAVISQRYSGLHLCKTHFEADFESKAKRSIRTHRWIVSGDRIGVALNGEPNSNALLIFLHHLLGKRKDVELFGMVIDRGIGYRDPGEGEGFALQQGTPLIVASFREMLRTTIPEIAGERGDQFTCASCDALYLKALHQAGKENGITKIALGCSLDDEAQGILVRFLDGSTDLPEPFPESGHDMIELIRPFILIPEREAALYAYYHTHRISQGKCPYSSATLRSDVRDLLYDYAWRHPSTFYSLVNLGEHLIQKGAISINPLLSLRCGNAVSGPCRIAKGFDGVCDD